MRTIRFVFLSFTLSSLGCQSSPSRIYEQFNENVLVIGHRGASGYLPEHTLESYELAIEQGADFIEPDLVSTKDGVLICRHENEISETTDVADKFKTRKTEKIIDGKKVSGWFTEDFDLSELKTLRAKQRVSTRSQAQNGQFQIPTFEEVIELVQKKQKLGKKIGLIPEIKHSSYFAGINLKIEPVLIAILKKHQLNDSEKPILIQSFEVKNLQELKSKISVRLVQLIGSPEEQPFDAIVSGEKITYKEMLSDDGLKKISKYAHVVSGSKKIFSKQSEIIEKAHALGLKVVPYTFKIEDEVLAGSGGSRGEYIKFFKMGIDGLFTDYPDQAVKVRSELRAQKLK